MKIEIKNPSDASAEISFIGELKNRRDVSEDNLKAIQDNFKKLGVFFYYVLNPSSDIVWCKFSAPKNPRRAGRKRKLCKMYLTEIDILILLSQYKNAEIIEMTGMSEATYYRAKKKLISGALYKAVRSDGNLTNISRLAADTDIYTAADGTVYHAGRFC